MNLLLMFCITQAYFFKKKYKTFIRQRRNLPFQIEKEKGKKKKTRQIATSKTLFIRSFARFGEKERQRKIRETTAADYCTEADLARNSPKMLKLEDTGCSTRYAQKNPHFLGIKNAVEDREVIFNKIQLP